MGVASPYKDKNVVLPLTGYFSINVQWLDILLPEPVCLYWSDNTSPIDIFKSMQEYVFNVTLRGQIAAIGY